MNAASNSPESAGLLTLLRSFGQIVLQPNAATGACLLAAWLLCDPRLACGALIGAIAANIAAIVAGCPEDDTRDGLHGFNGALAGLAAYTFVPDHATAAALAILAATGTAWLLQPWSRWLRSHGLGTYSSPCLIVTWLWLPLMKSSAAALPGAPASMLVALPEGTLSGLAQSGFAYGALPGLLMLVGIALSSRRHALAALAGSAIAGGVHMLLGSSIATFDAGLVGFNGALTALALAESGWVVVLGGVLLSVALQQLAGLAGLPAMTAPFVVACWGVQWLMRRGSVSRRLDSDVRRDVDQAIEPAIEPAITRGAVHTAAPGASHTRNSRPV
ncbi:urea transporter [Paraburkholderia sp. DHOC27]|uniref:urea transporter n=1 Tax=Paraburkholderia sp. DHOC27 TaxID=2303330 RepID=UPI000E3D80BE|nr:urea transporter [Paraburkholderia sp. DHOC27]RFU44182.1 urea transporter [Paraburkholderia sp. DHOC27]